MKCELSLGVERWLNRPEPHGSPKTSLSKDRLVLGEAVLGGRDGGGVEIGTEGIETGCGTEAGGSTVVSPEVAGADSSYRTLNRFPVGT